LNEFGFSVSRFSVRPFTLGVCGEATNAGSPAWLVALG
jgi:hypothetical protein